MRIAYCLSQIDNTGPFIVAKDVIDVLLSEGHHIEVFYLHGEVRYDFPVIPKKIQMTELADFSSFDIVHTHGLRADVYVHLHRGAIRKLGRPRTVSTTHQYNAYQTRLDYPPYVKSLFIEYIWKRSLRSKDAIISLTRDMALHYNKYLDRSDCLFVHNGREPKILGSIDPEVKKCIDNARAKGLKIVGSAGHLVKRKAFELLVEIAALRGDLFVVILGKGPEEERLKTLAMELGVSDRLILCGFKENPCEYFAQFDLFVLCSKAEGFSLVIAEAAAMSTPSICSNFSFVRELYLPEEVPVFEIGNIHSMSLAMDQIFNDQNGFARRVHDRYKNCYTKDVMARNYWLAYNSVLLMA